MKNPSQIDLSVLMLFFNRPDTLQLVFNEVKKARPARLFLYQDGPRNEQDMENVLACRKIVEDIDWDCEIHRNYQEKNYGCDPSGFLSQQWAFSLTDKCVVLEDDCVPSQSFFLFCKEMLDKYEHDERIMLIEGFNNEEVTTDVESDYFFTSFFSIWGWASWSRVINRRDGNYTFMNNPVVVRQLEALVKQRGIRDDFMQMCREHKVAGKPYFESVFWSYILLNSGLAIMPARNLVNNVGLTADSTHYSNNLATLPRGLRRIFTMQRFELQFPLQAPNYMIEHVAYKDRAYRINAWNHPLIKIGRSMEEFWLNLCAGKISVIGKALLKRFRKWLKPILK